MLDDGRYTAVLDRIEEGTAVLVLERDGRAVDDLLVPLSDLPNEARLVDAVFEVTLVDGDVVDVTFGGTRSSRRRARARRRFDRLARRLTPVEVDEDEDEDEGDASDDGGGDTDAPHDGAPGTPDDDRP